MFRHVRGLVVVGAVVFAVAAGSRGAPKCKYTDRCFYKKCYITRATGQCTYFEIDCPHPVSGQINPQAHEGSTNQELPDRESFTDPHMIKYYYLPPGTCTKTCIPTKYPVEADTQWEPAPGETEDGTVNCAACTKTTS